MTAPRSDAPVADPSMFRLRGLEEDWTSILARLVSLQHRTIAPIKRYGGLSEVLAKEAEQWFQMGRGIGYFADAESLELGVAPIKYEEPVTDAASFFLASSPSENLYQFAAQLNLAREDLTRDRLEYLALMMFASEDEWTERREDVEALAEALESRPWGQLPAEKVDAVSWALQGAVSEEGASYSPAAWRLGDLVDYYLGEQPYRVNERRAEIAPAQERIRLATEAIVEVQDAQPGKLLWGIGRGEELR